MNEPKPRLVCKCSVSWLWGFDNVWNRFIKFNKLSPFLSCLPFSVRQIDIPHEYSEIMACLVLLNSPWCYWTLALLSLRASYLETHLLMTNIECLHYIVFCLFNDSSNANCLKSHLKNYLKWLSALSANKSTLCQQCQFYFKILWTCVKNNIMTKV